MNQNSNKSKIISITVLSIIIVIALFILAFSTNTKRLERVNIETNITHIDVSYGIDYYRVSEASSINDILEDFNNTTLVNIKATDDDFNSTPIIMAFYDTNEKVVFSCELYENGLYKNNRFYRYTDNSQIDYETIKNKVIEL